MNVRAGRIENMQIPFDTTFEAWQKSVVTVEPIVHLQASGANVLIDVSRLGSQLDVSVIEGCMTMLYDM